MCVYVDTYTYVYTHTHGLPRWLSGKESAFQCRRCRFHPWVGKIPWRRKWQPSLILLPGESHGQRSLAGYSPWSQRVRHILATGRAHTHTDTHTHVYMQNNKMRASPSLKDVWRSGDPTRAWGLQCGLEWEPQAAVSSLGSSRRCCSAFPALLRLWLHSPFSELGPFAPSVSLPVIAGLRRLNGSAPLEPG